MSTNEMNMARLVVQALGTLAQRGLSAQDIHHSMKKAPLYEKVALYLSTKPEEDVQQYVTDYFILTKLEAQQFILYLAKGNMEEIGKMVVERMLQAYGPVAEQMCGG